MYTYADRYCVGTPLYLTATIIYELYYACVMFSTEIQRAAFQGDVCCASVAIT